MLENIFDFLFVISVVAPIAALLAGAFALAIPNPAEAGSHGRRS